MIEVAEKRTSFSGHQLLLICWCLLLIVYPFREVGGYYLRLDLIGLGVVMTLGGISYCRQIWSDICMTGFRWFALFVGWTFLVNLFYSVKFFDFSFLLDSLVLAGVFFFLVLLYNLCLENPEKFMKWTSIALSLSLVVTFVGSFLVDESYFRRKIYFENINQLSRYALFSLSILGLIRFRLRENGHVLMWLLSVCIGTYLILITYSKAAMVGLVVFVVICFFVWWKDMLVYLLSVGLLVIVLLHGGTAVNKEVLYESVSKRLSETDEYSSLGSRGYLRIIEYPQYLLLGAGEGQQGRFNSNEYEIHSTFFNVLFSYGVVGFSFFLLFICVTVGSFFRFDALFGVPIFLHSIAHNDIRSIHLWLFVLLFACFWHQNFKIKAYNEIAR